MNDARQEERVTELVAQIREVIASPTGLSSDPRAVSASPPYRELVALGEPALEATVGCLRAGDHFLNDAVLEMAHIQLSDLGLTGFPAEQQIAGALVALFEPITVQIFITAVAAMPAPEANRAKASQSASFQQTNGPITPRIKKLIEQRV